MKFTISRVILFVDDIKKTTEFYENIIGLDLIGERNNEFNILDGGGCQLCLHQIPSRYSNPNNSGKPRKDSAAKVVFYSDSVETDRAELIEKGVKMKKTIKFGNIEFCDGCDCEGNIFQISSRVAEA